VTNVQLENVLKENRTEQKLREGREEKRTDQNRRKQIRTDEKRE
jgi:hypothetical protein